MFARYCAVVGDHGVGDPAPFSSFSAITGFEQCVEFSTYRKKRSARASRVDGSAGAFGVPTRSLRCRSKYTVVPPRARIIAGSWRFGAAATRPGRANSFQKGTDP